MPVFVTVFDRQLRKAILAQQCPDWAKAQPVEAEVHARYGHDTERYLIDSVELAGPQQFLEIYESYAGVLNKPMPRQGGKA